MAAADDGLDGEPGQQDLGLTRRANPEARMSLLEHIRELRSRVIKSAAALTAGSIAGWFLYQRVWNFVEAPYCKARIAAPITAALSRSASAIGPHCQLYVTGVFDSFFIRMQVTIVTGAIISMPIWLYQLWAFIAPGLYKRERRWAYYFVGAAVPLFGIGATIAYFAMTRGLRFLVHYMIPANVTPLITINTYLSYAGAMLLIFGAAFELPLVLVLLNVAGVLTHARFRKWRRMIIFLVFLFAAIFTPSPDPISMLLLAIPCVVLVEAAEVFVWLNDRRRGRRGPYPGLTAEELAQYGLDKPLDEEASATK
jgi:sec-independent protein translocase protein TatC